MYSIFPQQIRLMRPPGGDYNTHLSVSFPEFLKLLEVFAALVSTFLPQNLPHIFIIIIFLKLYPKSVPEIGFRRLLLENIFLLANRRSNLFASLEFNVPQVFDA